MRAVMLQVPERLLEERRRTGADRFDEVWEGVLHMVPPPSGWHQEFIAELILALGPFAAAKKLRVAQDIGLFRPGSGYTDYRQPDLAFFTKSQRSVAGIESAEVVFEILSPDDESRAKLGFYERMRVKEFFVVDPNTRAIELYVRRGKKLVRSALLRSAVLGVTFSRAGRALKLRWRGGHASI